MATKQTFYKDDFKIINDILNKFGTKYNVFPSKRRSGVIISINYDKNNKYTGPKNPQVAYNNVSEILKHKDEFIEYLNEHPKEGYDANTLLNLMKDIQDKYEPEEVKKNKTLTTQIQNKDKELEESKQKEEQATEAFKGFKDTYHDELAEQKNINKNLQDKIESYEQRFKELEKAPLKRNYIMNKVNNESYSLDKGELMNVIKNDVENHILPEDTDIEQIADAIYAKATKRIYKNLRRINKLSVLSGYNPDLYNKLPAEVAEIVKNYMNDKINEDIRKKNIRYILPKEKPRWEKAMQKYNLNPMLGRGAYVI